MDLSMRSKRMGVLQINVKDLPYRIACWKRFGATEKVERGQRILDASIAEISRRKALEAAK